MDEKKSMLDWMKKNEKKFNEQNKSEKKSDKSYFRAMKTKKKEVFKEKIPQKTLDIFAQEELKPTFYDETFTSEDFKKITKKWANENLI